MLSVPFSFSEGESWVSTWLCVCCGEWAQITPSCASLRFLEANYGHIFWDSSHVPVACSCISLLTTVCLTPLRGPSVVLAVPSNVFIIVLPIMTLGPIYPLCQSIPPSVVFLENKEGRSMRLTSPGHVLLLQVRTLVSPNVVTLTLPLYLVELLLFAWNVVTLLKSPVHAPLRPLTVSAELPFAIPMLVFFYRAQLSALCR
jgi:hypothetical protein